MTEHDQILVALRRITRAIDLQSKRLLKETGLTAPQLVVLRALEREGPLPPSKIADRVSLSPATVTTIVERLTRLGLVERRTHPTDGRAKCITLTPLLHAHKHIGRDHYAAIHGAAISGIDEKDYLTMLKCMELMHDNLQTLDAREREAGET